MAYLNLENAYGQPPDEAVMKLFQRALQHVDQKKLYLALLAILDSSKKACLPFPFLRRAAKTDLQPARCAMPHSACKRGRHAP